MFGLFKKEEFSELEGIQHLINSSALGIYEKIVYEGKDKYNESDWSESEYGYIERISPFVNIYDLLFFRPIERTKLSTYSGILEGRVSQENLSEEEIEALEQFWKVISLPLSYLPWKTITLSDIEEKVLNNILEYDITPFKFNNPHLLPAELDWGDEELDIVEEARYLLANWSNEYKNILHRFNNAGYAEQYRKCLVIMALDDFYR